MMKILKENSVFWSKLGYCYDPPRLGPDNKQILFASDFEYFERIQKDLTDAGIKIVSSILFSGWIGVNQYDYELTDKVLEATFRASPDAWYIPRIKLNVPIEWCAANPEEVFVYADGPRDVKGIKQLIGTAEHDILGYDAPYGYQNTFGYNDDRPNINGKIALQSFSSQKWLRDAGDALKRIVQYLEKSPYADRILAYHIAYGVCGETCFWGRFDKSLPGDWGIANCKAFFDWGIARYGNLEKLRNVWDTPDLTRENAAPALPVRRHGPSASLKELMHGDIGGQLCVDYELFNSDININAMEHFAKIVKTNTDCKSVGYFYGYILECENAGYSGWLEYDRVLNSPYIDFIAAPKSYYRNAPGSPGGVLGVAQSVNRKKLWIDEIDNHTHLAQDSNCKNFAETRSVLWREFAKNLSFGSNFWWMDLGGGWYDSPEIIEEIRTIEKLAAKLRKKKHKSIAQTLLIVDEYSLPRVKYGSGLHRLLLMEIVREFFLTGSLVDIYRLSDLDDLDLSQYKLVVPLNTFLLDRKTWSRLEKRMMPDSFTLWLYAPGAATGDDAINSIANLTGFNLLEHNEEGALRLEFANLPAIDLAEVRTLPWLEVIPEINQEVLGWYSDGKPALVKAKGSIYSATPILKSPHLAYIMECAGCRFYAPEGSVVYGDNRFIAIFNENVVRFDVNI